MQISDFRGILNYVRQFRGKTFVLAAEGEVIASDRISTLLMDVAMMHSLSMKVILVHGAGRQIQDAAADSKIAITNHNGTGRTDDATLDLSIQVISRLNFELIQRLARVRLRGVSGSFVEAERAGVHQGEELENTGRVVQVDAEMLGGALERGFVPVVAPLAQCGQGRMLRLNSDQLASQIAVAVGASKLIFLGATPVAELLETTQRELCSDTAAAQAEKLAQPARAKLKEGAKACRNGVPRVHFLDGMADNSLLRELFDNQGVGAMIYADEYRKIRPMEKADVPVTVSMMRDSIDDEAVLDRSAQTLQTDLERFSVLVVDGNLVGCAALYPDDASQSAEIASLFIQAAHRKRGYGRMLIEHLEEMARNRGCRRVFALTTQAAGFFSNAPYQQGSIDDLPEARKAAAEASGRNAYVFYRDLEPAAGAS